MYARILSTVFQRMASGVEQYHTMDCTRNV